MDLDSFGLPNIVVLAVVAGCPKTKGVAEELVDALELPNKLLELVEVFVEAPAPKTLPALVVFTGAALPNTLLELETVMEGAALPNIVLEFAGVFKAVALPNRLLETVGAGNAADVLNPVPVGALAGAVEPKPLEPDVLFDCTALPNMPLVLVWVLGC